MESSRAATGSVSACSDMLVQGTSVKWVFISGVFCIRYICVCVCICVRVGSRVLTRIEIFYKKSFICCCMDLIDHVCIIIQADHVLSVYRTVTEGSGQFSRT